MSHMLEMCGVNDEAVKVIARMTQLEELVLGEGIVTQTILRQRLASAT